ncbi:MAG: 50S ribosomal protein L25 [Ignavibacteriales bacterium]|nr:50S ribosomal protein L25 [Ignavibacteriales bacterium]
MKEITLPVEVRTQQKKKVGQLRRDGLIPGIFYLHGEENVPLKVREKHLLPLIRSTETHILNLTFSPGGVRQGIIREVQVDPVTERPLHVDFQGVRSDEKLTLEVPIVLTGGTPAGVRLGGILQHVLHTLHIECFPKDIPEQIEINVSELMINHSVHVKDLSIENVQILNRVGDTIVSVIPPIVEKTPVAGEAAAEEAKEVEVIGKGKKEDEEAEGEGKAKGKETPKAAGKEAPKK